MRKLAKALKRLTPLIKQGLSTKTLRNTQSIIEDEGADAIAVFLAILGRLGKGALAWEPESIWTTLERQGVGIGALNMNKYNAVAALYLNNAFFWDADVFSSVIAPLNNLPPVTDGIEEYAPAQVAWAVLLSQVLYKALDRQVLEVDREPQVYTAMCLLRSGYHKAPVGLQYANEALSTRISDVPPDVEVQKKLHSGVQQYLKEHAEHLSADINKLL